jgi:23S rRNA (adenine2030-N6)-methyltransferase
LNYRHAFHAGNFADLVKHAALLQLLAAMREKGGPLTVVDTHAGRGLYDLGGEDARRSGEAQAGIVRLMAAADAPVAFAPLRSAVAALNGQGEVRRYPGSPLLIAGALGPADRYVGFELRPEEHQALRQCVAGRPNLRTLCADGFAGATAEIPARGQALLLIDPPFERADDYRRIVQTLVAARRRNAEAVALIWLPLKDLETFDGFLRDLEDSLSAPLLVGETRMRPLSDPMKMNGCALVALGAPAGLADQLEAICGWTAAMLGEGGSARVYRL